MSKTPRFKPIKTTFQMSADRSKDVTLTLTHNRKGYVVKVSCGSGIAGVGPFALFEDAQKRYNEELVALSVKAAEAGFPLEYVRQKTGRKIPCPGEAHKNPIGYDHCMVCLPSWGEVDELAPVDLDAARAARLDVPCGMLTDAEFKEMRARCEKGEAELVGVHRGNAYYNVFRWTGKSVDKDRG